MMNIETLENAELGEYLYLAMGMCDNHKVVMATAYTPEYADKKAKQFEAKSNGLIEYLDISVIKVGEKKKCFTLDRYQ